ncbi:MAG: hypothetical protein NC191_03015 [Muribaculaceae bacterium]|nr:hypothetical protein [Muribaculaceae bacterium]
MQVSRIPSNNFNNQPNFGELIISSGAKRALKKMLNSTELEQVAKWKEELQSTKNWDLEMYLDDDRLRTKFQDKKHPKNGFLNAVSGGMAGDVFVAHGRPLFPSTYVDAYLLPYPYENCSELRYPTKRESYNAFCRLKEAELKYFEGGNKTIDRISWAVEATKVLEENSNNKQMK